MTCCIMSHHVALFSALRGQCASSPSLFVSLVSCGMIRVRLGAKSSSALTSTCLKQGQLSLQVLPLAEVSTQKVFATAFLRDFDLPAEDFGLPFRVYVLRCEQQGFRDSFCYYVGLATVEELQQRMDKHFARDVEACKYTAVHKPLGVELLWPARHRAAEGYLFQYVLSKFRNEKDVLHHVRLGGFVQTSTKPLSTENYNGLARQYRMVRNLCLDCGLSGHKANSGECKLSRRSASSPVNVVLPLAPTFAPSPPRAEPAPRAPSADNDFEEWLAKRRRLPLSPDAQGWISLKSVLVALGESPQNPMRFVSSDSDSPAKLWKLGQRKVPKQNTDWKKASASTRSPLLVRKDFLKQVVQERYPALLRKRGQICD